MKRNTNKYSNLIEDNKTYGPFTAKLKIATVDGKGSDKYICDCKCGREFMLSTYQLATGDGAVCPSCGLAHNPTGIAGVHPHPSGSYKAEITWREAKISLGYYPTLADAALIRKEAEVYLRHATELELAKIYGGPQMSLDDKLALIGLDVNTRAIDVVRGAI